MDQADLRTVAFLHKKAVLGDIPLLLAIAQPAFIVTETEVTVVVFSRDEVREGLEARPDLRRGESNPTTNRPTPSHLRPGGRL